MWAETHPDAWWTRLIANDLEQSGMLENRRRRAAVDRPGAELVFEDYGTTVTVNRHDLAGLFGSAGTRAIDMIVTVPADAADTVTWVPPS